MLRRAEVRGLPYQTAELLALLAGALTPAEINAALYGLVGDIVAIDPDDAASAGVSTRLARADHGHEFLTAAPSALTKTASNTEGSSGDGARADHGHSTANLPWGVMSPRQILTSSGSGITASGATDFALDNMVVDSTRLYRAHLKTPWSTTSGGRWLVNLHVDGTLTDRIGDINELEGYDELHEWSTLWTPTSGTKDLTIEVVEVSGTSTLTFVATATATRQFWVEDIGPR
jgi:hypothetical protein